MGGDGGYLPCDSSALMGQPTGVSRSAYLLSGEQTLPRLASHSVIPAKR